MSTPTRSLKIRLAVSAAMVLSLTACRVEDRAAQNEPLFVPASGSVALVDGPAPDWSELPRQNVSIGQPSGDGYDYAERAYAMDQAFYQSAPDYGFEYGGAQPLVWESQDDWRMYAEPINDGYRYYYYEPGETYPYFVRDREYGYGYGAGGVLVTVYDSRGALMAPTYLRDNSDRAGRYLARARTLREASSAQRRFAVDDTRWAARRPAFVNDQARWFEAARRQPAWNDHRAKQDAKDLRRFERERERRGGQIAKLDRVEARQNAGRTGDRFLEERQAPPAINVRTPERRVEQARPAKERVEQVRHGPPQRSAQAEEVGRARPSGAERADNRPSQDRGAKRVAERAEPRREARIEAPRAQPEHQAKTERPQKVQQREAKHEAPQRQAKAQPERRAPAARDAGGAGKNAGGRERKDRPEHEKH